jgi:hypothetical protein
LWSLLRRAGSKKPSSRLSEGYICRIVDVNFAEFPFHAVSILENGCGRRFGAA